MAVDFTPKERYEMQDLLEIVRLLRSEQGCPWDKEQTHKSLRKNLVEETCEACEAIDTEDTPLLREELGDVLLQIALHAQIEQETGAFGFTDVCTGICKKLILRHPHVFGSAIAATSDEVLYNWDAIKKKEKQQETYTQTLRDVPKALPALMRACKIQHRAARAGFDYPDTARAMSDLRSEVEELDEAIGLGDKAHCVEELGDLVFSAVNVARFIGTDPEEALGLACKKFVSRFALVEQFATKRGIDMKDVSIDELDKLWKEAKKLATD